MSRYTSLVPPLTDRAALGQARRSAGFAAPSFVYAIEAATAGRVKIGRAKNPEQRVNDLQTGSAELLDLICVAPECRALNELEAHRFLSEYRRQGEWFDLDGITAWRVFEGMGGAVLPYPTQTKAETFWCSDDYRRAVLFHERLEELHRRGTREYRDRAVNRGFQLPLAVAA